MPARWKSRTAMATSAASKTEDNARVPSCVNKCAPVASEDEEDFETQNKFSQTDFRSFKFPCTSGLPQKVRPLFAISVFDVRSRRGQKTSSSRFKRRTEADIGAT